MLRTRNIGAALALGALVALPACSMFGGDQQSGSGSRYSSARGSSYGNSNSSYAQTAYGNPTQSAPPPGASVTGEAAITPDLIRDVQSKLAQNGDYKGRPDAVWGPRTEAGVKRWQQQHNLSTTGQLDVATLQSMDLNNNQADNGNASNNATNRDNGNANYSAANNPNNPNNPNGNPNGAPPSQNYSNINPPPPNPPANNPNH